MAYDILIANDGEVQTIQHTDSFSLVTDEVTAMAGYDGVMSVQHDIIMLVMSLAQRSLEKALDRELEESEENSNCICVIGALIAANMAANIIDKRSDVDKRFEGYANELADATEKLFNRIIDEIGINMNFLMITEDQRKQMLGEILMKELEKMEESD